MLSPSGFPPAVEHGWEINFSIDGTCVPRAVCYHNTLLNIVLQLCCQRKGLRTPEVSLWQSQLAWIKGWGCWCALTQSALLAEIRVTPFHPHMVGWAQQTWKGTSVCGHFPVIRAEWKFWAKLSTQAQLHPSFTAGRWCLYFPPLDPVATYSVEFPFFHSGDIFNSLA